MGEQEIYLAAQYGGVADNAVQRGVVSFAPKESGLKEGDMIYFHHLLIDEIDINSQKLRHRNYHIGGVDNIAYICEKGNEEERTGWNYWIFAYKRNGKLKPYGDYVMCKSTEVVSQRENETIKWEGIEVPIISKNKEVLVTEPNIVEVISGKGYKKGERIVKKKDGDYPLNIDGVDYEFIHPRHIIGSVKSPAKGWSYIKDLFESTGTDKINGIILPTSETTKKNYGVVLSTSNKELKQGDEVIFAKSRFQRLNLPNLEPCFAVNEEAILAKVES